MQPALRIKEGDKQAVFPWLDKDPNRRVAVAPEDLRRWRLRIDIKHPQFIGLYKLWRTDRRYLHLRDLCAAAGRPLSGVFGCIVQMAGDLCSRPEGRMGMGEPLENLPRRVALEWLCEQEVADYEAALTLGLEAEFFRMVDASCPVVQGAYARVRARSDANADVRGAAADTTRHDTTRMDLTRNDDDGARGRADGGEPSPAEAAPDANAVAAAKARGTGGASSSSRDAPSPNPLPSRERAFQPKDAAGVKADGADPGPAPQAAVKVGTAAKLAAEEALRRELLAWKPGQPLPEQTRLAVAERRAAAGAGLDPADPEGVKAGLVALVAAVRQPKRLATWPAAGNGRDWEELDRAVRQACADGPGGVEALRRDLAAIAGWAKDGRGFHFELLRIGWVTRG